jgi:hypothetical protein
MSSAGVLCIDQANTITELTNKASVFTGKLSNQSFVIKTLFALLQELLQNYLIFRIFSQGPWILMTVL